MAVLTNKNLLSIITRSGDASDLSLDEPGVFDDSEIAHDHDSEEVEADGFADGFSVSTLIHEPEAYDDDDEEVLFE